MRSTRIMLSVAAVLAISTSYAQKFGCSTIERDPTTNQKLHVKKFDSTNTRGGADNYYLWNNGTTLNVKFLSGSKKLQEKVKVAAKQWEQHANIKFNFVSSGPAQIRIKLGTGNGHNSYIGSLCNTIDPDKQTMNLDTLDLVTDKSLTGTVLHEFGHALGLLHEHSSPISGIDWNKEKIYAVYKESYGWDKQMVDYQVFEVFDEFYTNGTQYDPKSIMHYYIASWETKNGYTVPWNYTLSAGDKSLISALYPKKGVRKNEVSRFAVTKYTKMDIVKNTKKGGLSIYPAFDLATAGKPGKIFFCAVFYDEDGYGLEDEDGTYCYGNTVAAVNGTYILPNKKFSYNKGKKKNFEMFIPFSQIPLPTGKHDLIIEFRAVQQTDDGEIKYLYQSKPLAYSLVKS